jgi:hypothetical protein
LALPGPVASELNTGLPINHGAAAPRAVTISVAFQNALLEMGLIRFVVLIVGGMSRCSCAFASFPAGAQYDALAGGPMRKTLQFRKKRCNFPKE